MTDNEKKDLNTDQAKDLQDLDFEELGNVAGGREIRNSEKRNAVELKSRLNMRNYELQTEYKFAEINKLNDRFTEALKKWREDIANAPEDGGDIYLTNYFSVYGSDDD